MTYYTADREAGNFIDSFTSYEAALEAIAKYEADDKSDGTYTEDFYEIEDENHMRVELDFSVRLRSELSRVGISQTDFAKFMKIPLRTLQHWLSGDREPAQVTQDAVLNYLATYKTEK